MKQLFVPPPAPRKGFAQFFWGHGIKTERDFPAGLFVVMVITACLILKLLGIE